MTSSTHVFGPVQPPSHSPLGTSPYLTPLLPFRLSIPRRVSFSRHFHLLEGIACQVSKTRVAVSYLYGQTRHHSPWCTMRPPLKSPSLHPSPLKLRAKVMPASHHILIGRRALTLWILKQYQLRLIRRPRLRSHNRRRKSRQRQLSQRLRLPLCQRLLHQLFHKSREHHQRLQAKLMDKLKALQRSRGAS